MTDSAGEFRLAELEGGREHRWRIEVRPADRALVPRVVEVESVPARLDLTLERGSCLQVRVRAPAGHELADLLDAPLELRRRPTAEAPWERVAEGRAERGEADFDGLPSGEYCVVARAGRTRFAALAAARLEPGTSASTELVLAPGREVRGVVVDMAGAPRAGVAVNLSGDGLWGGTATDEAGEFVLDDVPAFDVRADVGERRRVLSLPAGLTDGARFVLED